MLVKAVIRFERLLFVSDFHPLRTFASWFMPRRHEIDRTDRRHRRSVDGIAVGRPGRRSHQLAQFKLHDRPAAVDYARCDPGGDRPCSDWVLALAQVRAPTP